MENYNVSLQSINATAKDMVECSTHLLAAQGNAMQAAGELAATDTITGKTADSIKDYMTFVHGGLLLNMQVLFASLRTTFDTYNNAYLELDCDAHARYGTEDLRDVIDQLTEHKKTAEGIDTYYAEVARKGKEKLDNIYHYAQPVYDDISGLLSRFDDITKFLQGIIDRVEDIETTFEGLYLQKPMDMVADIREVIREQLNADPAEFNPTSLASSNAYIDLLNGYDAAWQAVEEQMENSNKAAQGRANCDAQLAYEARLEETAVWHTITTVSCVAINTVGAFFGPPGMIIAGAVSGMISFGVNEGLSQYEATGASWGELDWGRIAIETTFGGIACAITGYIGAATGGLANEMTSALGKLTVNVMGSLAKVHVNHSMNAGKETVHALREGKEFKDAVNEGLQAYKDDLGVDAGKGILEAGFKTLGGFLKQDFSAAGDKWKLIGSKTIAKVYETVYSGVVDRLHDAVEGEASFADIVAPENIIKDAASGGVESIIGEGVNLLFDTVGDLLHYDAWMEKPGDDADKFGKNTISLISSMAKEWLKKEGSSLAQEYIQADFDSEEARENWEKNRVQHMVDAISEGIKDAIKNGHMQHLIADKPDTPWAENEAGKTEQKEFESFVDHASLVQPEQNAGAFAPSESGGASQHDTPMMQDYSAEVQDIRDELGFGTKAFNRMDDQTVEARTKQDSYQAAVNDLAWGAKAVNRLDEQTVEYHTKQDRYQEFVRKLAMETGVGDQLGHPGGVAGLAGQVLGEHPTMPWLDAEPEVTPDGGAILPNGPVVLDNTWPHGEPLASHLGETLSDQFPPPFGHPTGDLLTPFGQPVGDEQGQPGWGTTVIEQVLENSPLHNGAAQPVLDPLAPPFGQTVGDQLAPPFGETVGDQLAPPFGQTVGDQLAPPFGQTLGDLLTPLGQPVGDQPAPPFGEPLGDQLAPIFGEPLGDEQGQPGLGTTVFEQILENSPLHNGAAQPAHGPLTSEDLLTVFPHYQYTDELGHLYRSEAPLEQDAPDPGLQE